MNQTRILLNNRNFKDSDNIFGQLAEVKDLVELDLSNNLLTELPSDLSLFEKLVSLDLSNNPFQNFESIALSLATLPSLTDLKINISNQNEAILILTNLPNIIYLNGKSTREETVGVDIDEKDIDSFSLNNEIENFNGILNRLNERMKPLGNQMAKSFFEEFHKNLSDEVQKINGAVDNTVPNCIYAANLLKSKTSIYSFFHTKALSLIEKKEGQVAGILNDILNYIRDSQNSMYDLIIKLNSKMEEKMEEKMEAYRKQTEEAMKSQSNLDDFKIQELERKLEESLKEREFFLEQGEQERNMLSDKIKRLESENKIMTEKLIQKAKDLANDEIHSKDHSSRNNLVLSRSSVNIADSSKIGKSSSGTNILVGPVGSRVLTKKMLLEIIEEIYSSKELYDKKCLESKMPRETLEQHMYTYLNQKYGLKNLIVEWATCIINGIRMFSSEDSEICLFGKILRNELEEDSRIVILKLKTTISELLNYFLKAKNPLKSNGDIKEITISKQNGFLLEDEWKGIIYYLFEKDDAYLIETKINEYIRKKYFDFSKIESGNKKLTREEIQNLNKAKEDYRILYTEFLKIILDFQIRMRDKYLRNFCYLFKKVDSDDNGIINEDEFIVLFSLLNVIPAENIEEEADRLLGQIDPFNHKQITFSDCVSLFSNDFYTEEDDQGNKMKLSILDKVSMNEEILQ